MGLQEFFFVLPGGDFLLGEKDIEQTNQIDDGNQEQRLAECGNRNRLRVGHRFIEGHGIEFNYILNRQQQNPDKAGQKTAGKQNSGKPAPLNKLSKAGKTECG